VDVSALRIVAFIRYPHLFVSREFESGEFPSIGDSIQIGAETFEVLAIDRIAFNAICIDVVSSGPPTCDGSSQFELTSDEAWDASSVELAKSFYT
jgi:hypothetical protein